MKQAKLTPEMEAKKFKKGQSGNPKGRPKGASTGIRACLNQLIAKDAPLDMIKKFEAKVGKMDSKTNGSILAQVLYLKALKGDLVAMKEVLAQTELPHPKDVKLSGDFKVNMPEIDADCL